MRQEKSVRIGDKDVAVKELTVAEIRTWYQEVDQAEDAREAGRIGEFDLVGDGLLEDVSLRDLERMTDCSMDELGEFTPSQLRELFEKCKEVNPDFFAFRARLLKMLDIVLPS